ncbi:hypothetical protein M422DRAFT_271117 [Sphaerobolus stellatus SS14]|uniref:Unplaced genomic scaffold SPHSTscaffold_396, whole genome shotgun sequence n=1 Tax=Sphaerobolus stellatus (strain SS14) TaxID=990650 RepID=A0A0C9T6P8_SPHS4|nr:hypothetical protein M422DRAFT_274549 [Sphaerobolus stellatus SS14]KIJ27693.1 hypothetical protein M422DRAFT_271117 [Sphaerobolus stellatus SS14]
MKPAATLDHDAGNPHDLFCPPLDLDYHLQTASHRPSLFSISVSPSYIHIIARGATSTHTQCIHQNLEDLGPATSRPGCFSKPVPEDILRSIDTYAYSIDTSKHSCRTFHPAMSL